MAFEEEIALIVRSENPSEVADQVAELKKITGYKIVEQPNQSIVDTYYDTPTRSLRAAKHSVRIRNVNDKTLVTVKGPSKKDSKGNSIRSEHEFEWPYTEVTPEGLFELFGLKRVQVRSCNRRVRNILWGKDEVIAELAIDDLTYFFGGERTARLFEVEIERKGKNNASLIGMRNALTKKFPELEAWEHSKLAMGQLLSLALLIDTDPETGVLNDISFDALDYFLS